MEKQDCSCGVDARSACSNCSPERIAIIKSAYDRGVQDENRRAVEIIRSATIPAREGTGTAINEILAQLSNNGGTDNG